MTRPNLKITFNGMEFFGGSIIFRGEMRTLTLMDHVLGALDLSSSSPLLCEWVDMDIPAITREQSPLGGRTSGTVAELVGIYNRAYEAERDQLAGS